VLDGDVQHHVRALRMKRPSRTDPMYQPSFSALLLTCGLIAAAIFIAYKKHGQTAPSNRIRYPLPEAQKIQLQTAFATLVATGALRANEVTFEEIVHCAETLDDYSTRDCSEAQVIFSILNQLPSRERRFHNLAFVADQVEVTTEDVLMIVREFARLVGQADQLHALHVIGIDGGEIVMARRGELPPDNAVVEFQLGSRQCAVPFVMYSKNSPLGLMETLPELLTPAGEPRRFFSAYFDAFLVVTYLSADQVATLNLAFSHQPDCFELLK
jgi:hypothetical protein